MKINTKKLAAGPVMAAALLCAVSVGVKAPGISTVYAATVTESTENSQAKRPEKGSQRGQNGEKPEEKGTRYVGKITSLTSSTITVELGEMKQKEKPADGTDAATGATKDSAKEKKDLDPEDFISLTGETKTITITDSTRFLSRGKKPADGTGSAGTAEEFTIADLSAGDYITFLADEDGTILEVSKGIGMGRRGGHGRPQDGRKQKETTAAAE